MFWQVLFVFLTALIAADAQLPACGETPTIHKVRAYRIIVRNYYDDLLQDNTVNFCRCGPNRLRINYEHDRSWDDPALTVTTHRYVNASWGATVTHKHMFCKVNAVVNELCTSDEAKSVNDNLVLTYRGTSNDSNIGSLAPTVRGTCRCTRYLLFRKTRRAEDAYSETFVCSERLKQVDGGQICANVIPHKTLSNEWTTFYIAKCIEGRYYCEIKEELDEETGKKHGRCVAVPSAGHHR